MPERRDGAGWEFWSKQVGGHLAGISFPFTPFYGRDWLFRAHWCCRQRPRGGGVKVVAGKPLVSGRISNLQDDCPYKLVHLDRFIRTTNSNVCFRSFGLLPWERYGGSTKEGNVVDSCRPRRIWNLARCYGATNLPSRYSSKPRKSQQLGFALRFNRKPVFEAATVYRKQALPECSNTQIQVRDLAAIG